MKNLVIKTSLLISDTLTFLLASLLLISGMALFIEYSESIVPALVCFILLAPIVGASAYHLVRDTRLTVKSAS